MTDKLDLAKDIEMHQRTQAINHALAIKDPTQQIIDGQVLCIDCDIEIGAARLAVKSSAARCIDCQQIWEYKHEQR